MARNLLLAIIICGILTAATAAAWAATTSFQPASAHITGGN